MGGTSHHWLVAGFLLGGAALSSAGVARAGQRLTPACEDLRIRVEGDLSSRWLSAVERACTDLASVPGTDPSARVRVAPVERDLSVEVTLADGRFAVRRLRTPDALRATLEALLVVPEPLLAPPDPPATRAARLSPPFPAAPAPAPTHAAETPAPQMAMRAGTTASTIGIELGGGLGGRVAGRGYLAGELSGLAELRVDSWLFGTVFRWDFLGQRSAPLVDTFEMETVGGGLLVGRRVPLGFGSFDAGVSPRLVVETQTFESRAIEQTRSATDVRLGAFARLAFGRSALRGLVELDAELSPSRLRRIVQLDPSLPALPSWSAGVTAGVMWGAAP